MRPGKGVKTIEEHFRRMDLSNQIAEISHGDTYYVFRYVIDGETGAEFNYDKFVETLKEKLKDKLALDNLLDAKLKASRVYRWEEGIENSHTFWFIVDEIPAIVFKSNKLKEGCQ